MQLQDLLTVVCAAVKPELVTCLVNTTRAQGSSHMFVCAAVADPRPVFTFRFNGGRITSNSSKYTLVTNNSHGTLCSTYKAVMKGPTPVLLPTDIGV